MRSSKILKSENLDYNRDYSWQSYIMLFLVFSFMGYLYEVVLAFFQYGEFINRGSMYGPWLPIYGAGAVLVLILLKRFRKKPMWIFGLSFGLCGLVEYFTGWFILVVSKVRYWDYTGYFLNINGFICLQCLLIFAIGCCLVIYFIAPSLDNWFRKIPPKILKIICFMLSLLFMIDRIIICFYPNIGTGITN